MISFMWMRRAIFACLTLASCASGPQWAPVIESAPVAKPPPPPPPVFTIGTPAGATRCVPPDGSIAGVAGRDDRWSVLTAGPLAKPSLTRPAKDPVFKTTIRRLSDRSRLGADRFEVNAYSQLQAISADGAYLLTTTDAGFKVRCVRDGKQLLDLNLAHAFGPRWHPTLAHLLVHYDSNDNGVVELKSTNITTGAITNIESLSDYKTIHVNPSFGELSQDGRWTAGVAKQEVDVGRKKVTGLDSQWSAFKTPSLRNVTKSAPYFHDGSGVTIQEATKLMASGGLANEFLDPQLTDRKLTDKELAQLIDFLGALECPGQLTAPSLPK